MPAYFGHWVNASSRSDLKNEITNLKSLSTGFRESILWRMGEFLVHQRNPDMSLADWDRARDTYISVAEAEIEKNPKTFIDSMNDLDFMRYTFEDYQIVLSNSIPANRILKILPQGNEFGRVLRQKKLAAPTRYRSQDEQ